MTTIYVPAPPKSAFNKNRPISDLLQHQLRHFQHIEAKLPAHLRSGMTHSDMLTEDGAARYIAHLTNALRSLGGEVPKIAAPVQRVGKRSVTARRPLAIAATEEPAKSVQISGAKKTRGRSLKGQKPRSPRP